MEWIAIRSVYHFGINKIGINIFEERIVVFQAKDFQEAHAKAEIESKEYAEGNNFILHPEQIGYKQDGEPLIDGYEIWSELFEAKLTLDEFYSQRYEAFMYNEKNA